MVVFNGEDVVAKYERREELDQPQMAHEVIR
jgi:hypothetical protein